MKKENYIKICPQCGSIDIKMSPAGLDVKMTMQDYCQGCEFWGIFPEVEESQVEEFKKEVKNRD